MTPYRHTAQMGEISGFGGGYEKGCQDMLEAGVLWLNSRTKADIKLSEYKGFFGIINPESADAKALSDVVCNACADCTGAMHHAVMLRLHFIAREGWEKYCVECAKGAS